MIPYTEPYTDTHPNNKKQHIFYYFGANIEQDRERGRKEAKPSGATSGATRTRVKGGEAEWSNE